MNPDRTARWSEWMGAAQGGDGHAYEALLREILPHVRDFIRVYIADEASAEDVAKTVLLSVHRARHSYRREQQFEPWLYAIVRKAVFDFRRRRGRHPGPEGPEPGENAGAETHPASDKPADIPERKKRTFLPKPRGLTSARSAGGVESVRASAGRSCVNGRPASRAASSGAVEVGAERTCREPLGCLGGAS